MDKEPGKRRWRINEKLRLGSWKRMRQKGTNDRRRVRWKKRGSWAPCIKVQIKVSQCLGWGFCLFVLTSEVHWIIDMSSKKLRAGLQSTVLWQFRTDLPHCTDLFDWAGERQQGLMSSKKSTQCLSNMYLPL